MNTTQRVRLCALDEMEPCSARRFDVGRHRIALVRIDDDVYAIGDTCTHAEVSLSEGEIDCDDRTLECWKHGSQFSLETGAAMSLPATRPEPVYTATVEDGDVFVEVPT
ncbi:MAG: non-heme iron oxygenase ferredoxin subunit [Acidimicrobiales bacterium]